MQHAQQRALRARRQALDLVEEDGAPVRLGEQARPGAMRIGEGAALVAEQLVFEQRVGQRRAIDRDEREPALGTEVMERTGRELLPVPVSPEMRTVASDSESRLSWSRI